MVERFLKKMCSDPLVGILQFEESADLMAERLVVREGYRLETRYRLDVTARLAGYPDEPALMLLEGGQPSWTFS
jgi:hypothetical protein